MTKHAPHPPELFTFRVVCELHPEGQHDIAIQIAHHNWVSFRFACNRKVDEAARGLSDAIVTCGGQLVKVRAAICNRHTGDVWFGRCNRQDKLVMLLTNNTCPLPECRPHVIDSALPFWDRLCRVGRLRRR